MNASNMFTLIVDIMKSARDQFDRIYLIICMCFSLWFVIITGMIALYIWKDVPFGDLLRDPQAVMGAPFYVGIINNIGMMMWISSGTIFLFSGWVLFHRHGLNNLVKFLLSFGLFTIILATDDLLMLHEDVFPYVGIPEVATFAAYMLITATILIAFHRLILKTDYLLLVTALFFFSISVFLDITLPFSDIQVFFEDSAKYIGITFWLIYFARTALCAMQWSAAGELDAWQSAAAVNAEPMRAARTAKLS